jgi:hypothetical protein
MNKIVAKKIDVDIFYCIGIKMFFSPIANHHGKEGITFFVKPQKSFRAVFEI